MKYITELLFIFVLYSINVNSQVGIGTTTPNTSAALELSSTSKALLLPHIPLQSKTDIITIPSPASGLMVYNTNNSISSVSEENRVYADIIYFYNGTEWEELMDDPSGISLLNLPRVFSKGRKTTSDTSCTGLNNAPFDLNSRDLNMTGNGSITADKVGFYKFVISIVQYADLDQFLPILYYTGGGTGTSRIWFTYAFKGPAGYNDRKITYSALIYLNAGEISGGFEWWLGGQHACTATNRIREQEVVWQYLGNI